MEVIQVSSIAEYVSYIEKISPGPTTWFRGVATPNHKPVPGIVWKEIPLAYEGVLIHQFLSSYQAYTNYTYTEWDLYTLMQHHGLPTRLLDWSESALVGLFFALTSESDTEIDMVRSVWVLHPHYLNRKLIGTEHVFCPSALRQRQVTEKVNLDDYLPINLKSADSGSNKIPCNPIAISAAQNIRRVSSQKGCFTLHGTDSRSIDEILEGTDHCQRIDINIRSNRKRKELIKSLANLGIDEEFIYQDLDSLSDRIKRENSIQ
ncbi:FRG domain-containing protein [Microbulbifer variabilis]|uniref:FRG domain-containing protein n=1 Tax=Microbulbifer variabilis TaxID=266805 RepID=UPI001CFD49DA|nr:FRG domain-containing protein [Microbulbifer variabilis]